MVKPSSLTIFLPIYSFLWASFLFGQSTIKGTISDEALTTVEVASILFKVNKSSNLPLKYIIAYGGSYQLEIEKEYDTLWVEVTSLGYLKQQKYISPVLKGNVYELNFTLKPSGPIQLKEVVVMAEKKAVVQKKDTTVYNVANFLDGTERKVEDVLKKLPGIQVLASGEIRYKGKAIQKILLDGDDLFGSNYLVGSKNINANILDKVEAIDRFSENRLLKDIEDSDKVALNLKLKEGLLDLSGNAGAGLGTFYNGNPTKDLSANVLSVSSKYKAFAVASNNNIGKNNTPFDYFDFTEGADLLTDKALLAPRVIPEALLANTVANERSNINNQVFANYNSVFKLKDSTRIKANVFYVNDRIESQQSVINDYNINGELFTTSDVQRLSRKPSLYRADIQLKKELSANANFEYLSKIYYEKIGTSAQITQNEATFLNSNLQSQSFFLKQELLYTKKLNAGNAFQGNLMFAHHSLPQDLTIAPAVVSGTTTNNQEARFKKTNFQVVSKLLGRYKNLKYEVSAEGFYTESPLRSSLDASSINQGENRVLDLRQSGRFSWQMGKWKILPNYKLRFINQHLDSFGIKNVLQAKDLVVEPEINVTLKTGEFSSIYASGSLNYQVNPENFLFSGPILINNRSLINNEPNLSLQKTQSAKIGYQVRNLPEFFELGFDVGYQKVKGTYFIRASITETLTQTTNIFTDRPIENYNASLYFSMFIDFLSSTVKVNSSYNGFEYFNEVNNAIINKNRGNLLQNELFFKTAFDFPVNFENSFKLNYSVFAGRNESPVENVDVQYTFKVIFKPINDFRVFLLADYFLPNNQVNEDYIFSDINIGYFPKKQPWSADLSIKNIFNEDQLFTVNNNDFTRTVFTANLLPYHFIFNFSYSF